MAGRPKMMLGRVDALTERAGELSEDVRAACPAQYLDRNHQGAESAWAVAVAATLRAHIALSELQCALFLKVFGHEKPGGRDDIDALKQRADALTPAEPSPEVPAGGSDEAWWKLTEAAIGRSASRWVVMEWVNDCLLMEPGEVEPASVPSQGAPGMLRWAKENRKEFYAKYLAGVEAEEQKPGASRGLMADGRDVRELVAELKGIMARRREAREEAGPP